jgi:hypothetical protein
MVVPNACQGEDPLSRYLRGGVSRQQLSEPTDRGITDGRLNCSIEFVEGPLEHGFRVSE